MVDTRIITYLGFKEMLVFTGSGDNVYSVDADLNRLIWKRHFDFTGTPGCAGGMTAPVIKTGSSTAGAIGRGRGVPGGNRGGEFYTVSSDGYFHVLNTSTGADRSAPVKFLPPNARVTGLKVVNNVIYAATLDSCGEKNGGVYTLDLATVKVNLQAPGATAGVAIAADGTVYTSPTAPPTLVSDKPVETTLPKVTAYASSNGWVYASTPSSVVGFKPGMTQEWSKDIASPSQAAIAGGVLFVLSTAPRAVLHALDAETGKELYTSPAMSAAASSGLTIANRRIYFTTRDNTVWCFGFLAEQPQLTGK
jgi:outer membrane protein assembly factor BamB